MLGVVVSGLERHGVNVRRIRLGLELRHPSLMAISWLYQSETGITEHHVGRDVTTQPMYLKSPVRPVKERDVREVRIHIAAGGKLPDYNLVPDLIEQGMSDYIALGLRTTGARADVITFATDKDGGFSAYDIGLLRAIPEALDLYLSAVRQRYIDWVSTAGEGTGDESALDGERGPSLHPSRPAPVYDPDVQSDRHELEAIALEMQPYQLLATPVWLFDSARHQIVWANPSAMNLLSAANIEAMWKRDLQTGMSAAMAHSVANTLKTLRTQSSVTQWTILEPLGEARRHCLVMRLYKLKSGSEVVLTETLQEPPAEQLVYHAANSVLLVALFGVDGGLVSSNPAFLDLFGALKLSLPDLLRENWNLEYFLDTLSEVRAHSVELPLDTEKGERWFRVELRKVRSERGDPLVFGTFFDITEHRLERQELQRLARTDVLTRIANRHGVMSDAQEWLDAGRLHTVMFLDLDGLKVVNDMHGHHFGDVVLQSAAERIRNSAGHDTLVGRMGGDEFLIVTNRHDAGLGERVRLALASPFDVDGVHLTVTASLGVAVFPTHAATLEDLVNCADMAALGAKRSGRNRVRFFAADMKKHSARTRQLNRLVRHAIANDELRLVVQPIVRLPEAQIVRGECLLRWNNSELGNVPPNEFIPAAEEAGMIHDIGRFVTEKACQFIREVEAETGRKVSLAVNVSAREISDPNYVQNLLNIVEAAGVSPGQLVLEMTETYLIDRLDLASETLATLKSHGFIIALDDFGTGYSSLSYLQRLDFDIIKLDRTLIMDLPGERALAITRSLLQLAQGLGAKVVAEGIETQEQKDCLSAIGCHYAQGYFFARPLEWPDFRKALKVQGEV